MLLRKRFTDTKKLEAPYANLRDSSGSAAALFIALSLAGLILVASLTLLLPAADPSDPWRRQLVGASFSLICILGILAGAFPSRCSTMFHFKKGRQKSTSQDVDAAFGESVGFRGHHPDCDHFSAHVIQVGDWVFCAGCVGLMLGAGLSLLGVVTFFFLGQPMQANHSLPFWAGFVGVAFGLLQYHVFNWGRASVHLIVNTYFVFGVFLLLVGIDGGTQNLTIESYLLVLSVLWIFTRILLSQIDHRKTCKACSVQDCRILIKKRRG
ncbi:MAG: hypothetical protein NWE81_00490 [Candidatus Bathyarchaeota archaeon]|nr:hypothetical protein [Candidatus Bathyarchaeota archaeon]